MTYLRRLFEFFETKDAKAKRLTAEVAGRFQRDLEDAKRGDADAQFLVAHSLRTGDGTARNAAEAVSWYRAAAEQGHYAAFLPLAHLYADGKFVDRSLPDAIKWASRAATDAPDPETRAAGFQLKLVLNALAAQEARAPGAERVGVEPRMDLTTYVQVHMVKALTAGAKTIAVPADLFESASASEKTHMRDACSLAGIELIVKR